MVINLKKNLWIILIFIIIAGISAGIYLFTKNNNTNQNNYTSSKTSANNKLENNIQNNVHETNTSKINEQENIIVTNKTQTEEVISSFSTKIYTKDSARQNNINITCSTLNDTIIQNGSTFSFCNTVGQATSSKGYQKADIFDKNGIKKKGLGGGNCQVSTTLYNAVLATSGLVVIERHEHSNKVPYIANGKDAAVAYGSYDLKFRNDTGFDIKIKTEANDKNVTITLCKLI